jgi:hypothetical protein
MRQALHILLYLLKHVQRGFPLDAVLAFAIEVHGGGDFSNGVDEGRA